MDSYGRIAMNGLSCMHVHAPQEGPKKTLLAEVPLKLDRADPGPGEEGSTEITDLAGAKDRRQSQRRVVARLVWYKTIEKEAGRPQLEGVARSCDLSETGVGIVITRALAMGTQLFMEITTGGLNLSAVGQVVFSAPAGEGRFRVGIRFSVVPPNDLILLRKYCRDQGT